MCNYRSELIQTCCALKLFQFTCQNWLRAFSVDPLDVIASKIVSY